MASALDHIVKFIVPAEMLAAILNVYPTDFHPSGLGALLAVPTAGGEGVGLACGYDAVILSGAYGRAECHVGKEAQFKPLTFTLTARFINAVRRAPAGVGVLFLVVMDDKDRPKPELRAKINMAAGFEGVCGDVSLAATAMADNQPFPQTGQIDLAADWLACLASQQGSAVEEPEAVTWRPANLARLAQAGVTARSETMTFQDSHTKDSHAKNSQEGASQGGGEAPNVLRHARYHRANAPYSLDGYALA
ncbi:hypothetical protein E3E12_08235 [Formicincola oecophyllae]|uniref:Uncharacterized protein n=1 Tax=Formicincola oecophyllae TaxID=2558361 RepID=A0A4Y6UCR4_9PROT|nr:hypothetical protein [Formicincola oecophyllae]QDH14181.1 hypothetical protein E3E12_08235 [Formicincola oecophyllae]